MPTKKGSSKASKAKKTTNKKRRAPKRGVTRRAGARRKLATDPVSTTGRVRATGAGIGTIKKAATETAPAPNPGTRMYRGPEGLPDRKATGPGGGAGPAEGGERIRDL